MLFVWQWAHGPHFGPFDNVLQLWDSSYRPTLWMGWFLFIFRLLSGLAGGKIGLMLLWLIVRVNKSWLNTIQAPPMGPLLANWLWAWIQVQGGSIQSEPNAFGSGSMVSFRPVSSIETAPSPVFCTSKRAYPSPDPTSEFRVLVDMGSGCSHQPMYIINCTMVLAEMQ